MLSLRAWRFIWVITIMAVLMATTVLYGTQKHTHWGEVSAYGLKTKVERGISQIYWQWQGDGRPEYIEYKTQSMVQAIMIKLNRRGVPVVENTKLGCEAFLSLFVNANEVDISNKVKTTFIADNRKSNTQDVTDKEATNAACQFEYAQHIYRYNLQSGKLTFS